MIADDPTILSGIVAVCVILFLTRYFSPKAKSSLPLPPQIKGGLPIIGNIHQVPKGRPWIQFAQWTKEYGPIYRLKLGRTNYIVLGDAQTANDLLEKRSSKYSSRPRQIMTSELVSRGLRLTFMQYGDLWRRQRRLLHQLTSPKAASSYEHFQDMESVTLLSDLIEKPEAFWGHGQRYAGSTIMQVAFNKRAMSEQDPAITEMRRVNEKMTKTAVAGRYLVDSIPELNFLPRLLAPFKREADEIFDDTLALFKGHFNSVKKDLDQGKDSHCFTKYIIEMQNDYGLTEDQSVFLAGAMYGAGSDTTADAIYTFFLTLATHPEVQRKAQEELDRVVGQERIPDFNDQPELVYCNAVIREVMRWRSVIAGGLAHATIEDDEYNGFFIPKGSTVIANHWSIHMDEKVYPEPELFKPERFIRDGSLVGTKYSERGNHAFGFGRRICPGMHIAERSLFIVFTRIMWAFNVSKNGPIDVNNFSEGFSSHPNHFNADIVPRGPFVKELVTEAVSQQQ